MYPTPRLFQSKSVIELVADAGNVPNNKKVGMAAIFFAIVEKVQSILTSP
jgi:hypothetical protein